MGRPRGSRDAAATRQRIVDVAARRFAADGYTGTSLAAIARDAGMTAPSLLYHFPSKEALFDDVLRAMWQAVGDQIAPILKSDLGAEDLLVTVTAVMATAVGRSAPAFAAINATLLSGSGIGAEAVNDTLLPIVSDVERAILDRIGDKAPEGAPIRQAILYLILAHTAQHQLGQLAPSEAPALQAAEPRFALALLRDALTEAS